MANASPPRSLKECSAWLDTLERARSVRTTGAWPLASVLDHLAQSIEMSMDGFPQPKGALFQMTAGRAAFAVFRARGKMSHGLAEPIPGAPPLDIGSDWKAEFDFLRQAFDKFGGSKVRKVFEPACGTGRLIFRLASVIQILTLPACPKESPGCRRHRTILVSAIWWKVRGLGMRAQIRAINKRAFAAGTNEDICRTAIRPGSRNS